MNFQNKLEERGGKVGSLLCVGLDPDFDKLPESIKGHRYPFFAFNRLIIEKTADFVCAFKPQIAFYASRSAENELLMTLDLLHSNYADIPLILDAKRGDVANTAQHYASEVFDRYRADALTVNPYMGGDSLTPFTERADKGVFILCRTSNPGSGDIQEINIGKQRLFEIIAHKAAKEWNGGKNVGLVVGATFPKDLKRIREIVGDMPLLIPGLGAQGGDIEATVTAGLCSRGSGMVINSSRGIIYAGKGVDFADRARFAARELRDSINRYR